MLELCLYQRIIALYLLRDATGHNVLHVAASCGHLDLVVRLLKKKGRIKVDLTNLESRWTALHHTAYLVYAGILAVLHRSGGNLEQLEYDKFSPYTPLPDQDSGPFSTSTMKSGNTCSTHEYGHQEMHISITLLT